MEEGTLVFQADSISEESYGTLRDLTLGARGQEEGQDGPAQTFVVDMVREWMLRRGLGGSGTILLEDTRVLPRWPPFGVGESRN